MDIRIGLTISADQEFAEGQFGVAIAGQNAPDGAIDVHVEAYGFAPTDAGAKGIYDMVGEVMGALATELGLFKDPNVGLSARDQAIVELEKTGLSRERATHAADTAIAAFGLKVGERLDHNTLDSQCVEHQKKVEEGFAVQSSGAARCPVCRPTRPPFNPQPIGGTPKQ